MYVQKRFVSQLCRGVGPGLHRDTIRAWQVVSPVAVFAETGV